MTAPTEVGCWSRSTDGEYSFGDRTGLPQYRAPPLPADLNKGYSTYLAKEEGESVPVELIVHAAKACNAAEWGSDAGPSGRPPPTLVSFRNNLNKICGTPLALGSPWALDACFIGGSLFLDIVKTPEQPWGDKATMAKFVFWGYSFEAQCTGQAVVDARSEFALLVRYKLGPHDVLMAAEVDAADPGQGPAVGHSEHFVELKTSKLPTNPKAKERMMAEKWPKWWVQSFLAGVPSLVMGLRDDNGRLLEVQSLPVQELPSRAAAGGARWNAWQLLRFGADLLSWMEEEAQQREGEALRFEYHPESRSVVCSVAEGGDLGERLGAELG